MTGAGATLNVNNGGTFQYNASVPGASATAISMAGSNQVVNNNGTLAITANVFADLLTANGTGFSIVNGATGVIASNNSNAFSNAISTTSAGVSGTIVNSGRISDTGGASEGTIYMPGSGGVLTLNNRVGGTIRGDITIAVNVTGTKVTHLRNAGTISTGVVGGTAISLGGGNDTVTLEPTSAITGIVNGGGGGNNLVLAGSAATNGSFNIAQIGPAAQYRNFLTFQKAEAGTWTLTGTAVTATSWADSGGTLRLGSSSLGLTSITTVGGDVGYDNGVVISSPLIQNAATRLIVDGTDVATQAGVVSGTGASTKTGAGTLVLTATNTYAGGTFLNAGTLQVSSDANLGTALGGLTFNGGTLENTAAFQTVRPVTLTGNGSFQTDANLILSGLVSGAGALIKTGAGNLTLARNGNTYSGTTTISAGTLVVGNGTTSGTLGTGAISDNASLVFNRSDTLTVANAISGTGSLTQAGSGTTILTGANSYGGTTTISAGTLQLGNGGTTGSIVGDVINIGALAFNRSDATTFGGLISGSGGLQQIGSGTTTLTGANGYTGATTVSAGTLIVNGNQSAATGLTTVNSGATIGGTGIIGGSVTVANGGTLAPGAVGTTPGTLTINGNLGLNTTSSLNYSFGQANVVGGAFNDLTRVNGNLTLDGTLNVALTPGGSLNPGIYRVISYGGTLTNNTLDVGTLPPGTPPGTFFVQTSVANQVNLVNTAGLNLNFWDGAAGPKNNGVVNGGNGTWHVLGNDDNWTEQTGTVNAPYANGAFAIFTATPGTVTVDNSLGAVTASGMQFASDGYVISGGTLTLVGAPTSTIRVGDGSAAGASFIATINSVLAGSTQLVKTDLGTLVLNGTNTYTGGTAINGGTVQVSSDSNLGAVAGGLAFDGGTLRTTADITMNRATALNAGGGTFETATGTQLTQQGDISGTGGLTKIGAGTLTLTGNGSYTGGTTITAGTLQLGNGGTTGSIVGDVINSATLAFNRSDTSTFGGVISGTGGVRQIGTGTTTLAAASTYSGPTSVEAGTLAAGGTNVFSPGSAFSTLPGGTLDLHGFDQSLASLSNAGLVRTGGAPGPGLPGTVLTTTNYTGQGGALAFNTYLGAGGSPSDKLVIDSGTATGSSSLRIANTTGAGALTSGNGILVVDATNGGTTATGAFTLGNRVVAGPYEYTLFRASVDTSNSQAWYLRSTVDCTSAPSLPECQTASPVVPNYRRETSLYAALPAMVLLYGRNLMDTLHERVGEERPGIAPGSGQGGQPSLGWGRLIALNGSRSGSSDGIFGRGPNYNYDISAFQGGIDLYRGERADGGSDHAGVYTAIGQISAGVTHFDGGDAGRNTISAYTLGGYWTHFGATGWYLDSVAQMTWNDAKAVPLGVSGLTTRGASFAASIAGGRPFQLGHGFSIEPQAQLIYQTASLADSTDSAATVLFKNIDSLAGRLGARLARSWALDATEVQPHLITAWLRPSLWYEFRGNPVTEFSSATGFIPFRADLGGSWAELNAGFDAQITRTTSFYANTSYQVDLNGHSDLYGGKFGVRVTW